MLDILSSRFNSHLLSDCSSNLTRKPVAFQERDPCEDGEFNSVPNSDRIHLCSAPRAPLVSRGARTGRQQPKRKVSSGSADSGIAFIDRDELAWFEKVGAGVTTNVFRGQWKGHPVAIKQLVLPKQKRKVVKKQAAFSWETNLATKVRHKNLVQFFGVVFEWQPYLMITEFMPGGTVFHLLYVDESVPTLSWKQGLQMCSDVASAMDYLHNFKPQIIHRDLKSLNLLLSETVTGPEDMPKVKVSDFGLANIKEEHQDWCRMTAQAGTIRWMAPEVHTGCYNEKADIYSYAMVLYEIICYEVPFQDFDILQVAGAVISGVRPRLDAVPPDCPVRLISLMILCWTQDQSTRPTFTQVCIALNDISFTMFG